MRGIFIVLIVFVLNGFLQIFAQNKVIISGFVSDQITGELLIGAIVRDSLSKNGTSTDYNGYFNLQVKVPSSLQVSNMGYKSLVLHLNKAQDSLINIKMEPGTELGEVIIRAQLVPKFNVATLNQIDFQQIPSIGGKPDVSKSLQLMPGIKGQNEGSSLLLVRGGDPGQNLYLFDQVPVIYVNHLGGFLSTFNPDIINNIDVYKGGFPSRYGGKLSSVVDITQKEGDKSGLKGSLGIGITDFSFSVEGPLKWKNSSFIVVGRKTLFGALMALSSRFSEGNDYIVRYGFHDINAKFTWKPNQKNSFSLGFYQGDDYLNYKSNPKKEISNEEYRMKDVWGNWLASLHWKSLLSSSLFVSNRLSYTRYRLKDVMEYSLNDGITPDYESKYFSSVQDLSLSSDWKYKIIEDWSLEFGLQSSLFAHLPTQSYFSNQGEQKKNEFTKSIESAIYAENRLSFFRNSEAVLGVRLINYSTNDYSNFSLEPRININIGINQSNVLNFGLMKATQYSHLLFTSGSITNNEIWVPANKQIAPAYAYQYTMGWKGDFANAAYTAEFNAFYKEMFDLATYKEGYSTVLGDDNWQSKIETGGKGIAKGCEFLIRKNIGKWRGFLAYSISNTTREYPNINSGKEYLFDYDRLHHISLSASYKINEKLTFNLVWVYQTGLPYTPAIGRQLVPSLEKNGNGEFFYYDALIYGERNSDRIKNYHRLDIGLNYEIITKRGRKAVWSFSVYNLYNRHNPYYYYFNTNNTGEIYQPELGDAFKPVSLYQLSLFPIIPTLLYKIYFDGNATKKEKSKRTFKQKMNNWLYYEN